MGWMLVLFTFLATISVAGCATRRIKYPGNGDLIIVDIDPDLELLPVTVEGSAAQTLGDAIRKAIRYWDQAGARLRTTDQLTVAEASLAAPHLRVTSEIDASALGDGKDAFFNWGTGEIQLFISHWATTNLTLQQWYWLVVTIAHEAGHAIGLDHVSDPTAVMYPQDTSWNARANLAPADMTEYARIWQ